MGAPNEHHIETRSYDGPERRAHICDQSDRIAHIEAEQAAVKTSISFMLAQSSETNSIVKHLEQKLLTGNGKDAIVVEWDKRLTKLESSIVPRDDVMEMVSAFKIGRGCIISIATVAAIGFLAILFWHLFKKATG